MSLKTFKANQDFITSLSYDNYELKKERNRELKKKE
jgi:hypothetical protein